MFALDFAVVEVQEMQIVFVLAYSVGPGETKYRIMWHFIWVFKVADVRIWIKAKQDLSKLNQYIMKYLFRLKYTHVQ